MVMDCKKEISAAKKRKPMADDKRERVQRRRIEVFFNACVAQCEHSGGLFHENRGLLDEKTDDR